MDWRIRTEWDGGSKQYQSVLTVDQVAFRFYGETRELAWALALKQLTEIWSDMRRAECAIELREEATWID